MSDPILKKARLDALGPGYVGRGQALCDAGAVSRLRQGRVGDSVVLTGVVSDAEEAVYRVYVDVSDAGVEGDCSCARRRQCEHVAALVLTARAGLARPERPAAVEARSPVARSSQQRMVYLLRLSEDGRELSVCPSRRSLDDSGEPVATPYALSRLEDARQPDYIGEDDLRILHELADRMAGALDLVWSPLGPRSQGLLRAMLATGRCHWNEVGGPVLSEGEPVSAHLHWQVLPSGYQVLMLEDEAEDGTRQLPLLPPWRVNPDSGQCRPLVTGHEDERVAELLEAGPVAPAEVEDLRQRLADEAPGFPRPQALELEQLPSREPIPWLALRMVELGTGQRFSQEPAACLRFIYGPVTLDWDEETASALVDANRVVSVERDRAAEELALARLDEAGLVPLDSVPGRDYRPGEGGFFVARKAAQAVQTWVDLQAQQEALEADGWQISGRAEFSPRLVEPEAWYGDLLAADEQGDLFDLDLGIVADGERHSLLPALLAWIERTPPGLMQAILEGSQRSSRPVILSLDDQRVVRLGADRLADTLRALVDAFDQSPSLKRGRLRLPRARLAELAPAGRRWQLGGDNALTELSQRLSDFEGVPSLPAPQGLNAELRPYQSYGLGWMQFLREFGFGGILADDMGLGKTIQTLAHIQTEKEAGRLNRPALVIAPTSLLFNWRAEARRFAPDLKVLTLHGPERKGQFQWIDESDLVLTTYPLLSRDAAELIAHEFHLLILDEAQSIKNPRTRAAREVRRLRARHRLCLSGTPLENHLGELWALFDFLMPGMLGSYSRFRKVFQKPIERQTDDERRETLARRIRPFFLRRTKSEVAPELPPKTEMVRAVALEGAQRRLYERYRVALHDKVRRALAGPGLDKSRIVVLDALLRLRQICCDPALLKEGAAARAGSAKRELLRELLPELVAEGRRVLIFSQFVTMLELIEQDLAALGIEHVKLTGQTRDRRAVVERFQSGQVPVFLISLKAGGVGLNLTAADTVIHYDPWWNPAVEDQATDRAHRIGQDQKVFVYRLLTEQTVEEKVFELQQSKRGLIEGLLGGGGALKLEAEDLDALFEPLA
ncbi:DEAD/DEAH box helicase [Wenzhouxiangella marina]|uniref:SNF2-related protein n=1 Tax=Wenzhouxiangella marina TaxID=1579979 RepID=A0A0K0XTR4_9GAMM|nr:DEAD/DEAH box helicase [Wenzhouxiangella marina]AKS41104.1 SNF2-related protein [Wenzhouxiangella marina]MBB6087983.1 superfamily II DNA or RNA helicase [Wenzhouxiangella marina]